jgi:methylglyoxal/glyoxal reductase
MMDIHTTYTLNNNTRIPVIGLGVFRNPSGKSTHNAVRYALEKGYRHIDTAKIYANEYDVGTAVKQSDIKREDIFITTKLWNSDQGYHNTLRAMDESLSNLQIDYVDLFLMHWPVQGLRLESWRAMEEIVSAGKAKAIGISNFLVPHVTELLDNCKIVPAVNQIELSPYNYLYRKDTIDFCTDHNILIEAYSPLTKGFKLQDKKLMEVAEKYHKTPAQILIRWALEHEFVVLPKSEKENRIKENCSVFDFQISGNDMQLLDNFNENLVTGWDPTDAP